MNILILEVIVLVSSGVHRQRVALQTDLAADPARVLGDRILVQLGLLILLVNAIDALRGAPEGTRALQIPSGTHASLGVLGLITDRFLRYMIIRFAHQYGPIE